jgi:creatinine amidohydrolase
MTMPDLSRSFALATRNDLQARAGDVVLVPVGACEQHGPHLPTATDTILVDAVANKVAVALQGEFRVIVAPTLPFGYSRHHLPFGATISVSAATLQRFLVEMCDSLVAGGFTRIFLLNGHGGNADIVNVVAREVALQHGITVGAGSYWVMAWEALVAAGAHQHTRLPGHAGAFETSVMLALHPELVRREDAPSRDGEFSSDPAGFHGPYLVEDQANWLAIDGYSDSPKAASAEDGERWFAAVVEGVGIALRRFHGGAETSRDSTVPAAGMGE